MALSVTTISPTVRLTTRQAVAALGLEVSEELADVLIDEASAAIRTYCHRQFEREAYTETLAGFGDVRLQLARTPVVTVSSVTISSAAVEASEYSIDDPGKGWLYRQRGWPWSAQRFAGLSGDGAWMNLGTPVPRSEEPNISVSYVAGWLLPEQNVLGGVTVDAADNSFNSSAKFPALLKAGDVIESKGFANTENNVRALVSGTPTTSKVIVSGVTLVTETPAPSSGSIRFANLPADLQKACNETVKTWYLTRRDNPSIVEKQAGPHRLRFSEQEDVQTLGLPASCVGLLRPYVRLA